MTDIYCVTTRKYNIEFDIIAKPRTILYGIASVGECKKSNCFYNRAFDYVKNSLGR